MAELKTQRNTRSVEAFLAAIADEQRRSDCRKLLSIMKGVTRAEPAMWGDSIVGFGSYRYRYAGGREGDWFLTGFSPRKQALTLYVMSGFERHEDLLKELGTFKIGNSCLYIRKLEDIDTRLLRQLLRESVTQLKKSR